jgi:hypothetical protein
MLAEDLVALAGTSARALVAAMTTDAWQSVRSGFARLFGRVAGSRQRIEVQLDRNAELVAGAPDPDRARLSLAGTWQLELESLLGQHPEAANDLRALLAQIQAELPPELHAWVQTNVAKDGGTVFAVQGGSLVVHGSPRQPGPADNEATNKCGDPG